MAMHIKSKKLSSKRLPMVPTSDTLKLPNKGIVAVHVQKKNSPIIKKPTETDKKHNPRRARLQEAFVRDGLSPEERLLKVIFGKKSGITGLPKELRTKERFERDYRRFQDIDKLLKAKLAKKQKPVTVEQKLDCACTLYNTVNAFLAHYTVAKDGFTVDEECLKDAAEAFGKLIKMEEAAKAKVIFNNEAKKGKK